MQVAREIHEGIFMGKNVNVDEGVVGKDVRLSKWKRRVSGERGAPMLKDQTPMT